MLTAGHVSRDPGQAVTVVFPDGRRVKAKSLGSNRDMDCGLVKIIEPGKWPCVPRGHSSKLKLGQWCLTIGHPGGFQTGRTPVVRLGRILQMQEHSTEHFIRTDCPLIGGDSGGPLFDLDGKVIGIHSRIGQSLTYNFHVPVDEYSDSNWDRMVVGEVWGKRFPGGNPVTPYTPYLGFEAQQEPCQVTKVEPESPAAKGGLQVADIILRFNGNKVDHLDEVRNQLDKKRIGDPVTVEVERHGTIVHLQLIVGKGN